MAYILFFSILFGFPTVVIEEDDDDKGEMN
jgi:hypothetical protein